MQRSKNQNNSKKHNAQQASVDSPYNDLLLDDANDDGLASKKLAKKQRRQAKQQQQKRSNNNSNNNSDNDNEGVSAAPPKPKKQKTRAATTTCSNEANKNKQQSSQNASAAAAVKPQSQQQQPQKTQQKQVQQQQPQQQTKAAAKLPKLESHFTTVPLREWPKVARHYNLISSEDNVPCNSSTMSTSFVGIFWDILSIRPSAIVENAEENSKIGLPIPILTAKLQQFASKFGTIAAFNAYYRVNDQQAMIANQRAEFAMSGVKLIVVPELVDNFQTEAVDNAMIVDMCMFESDVMMQLQLKLKQNQQLQSPNQLQHQKRHVIILLSFDGDFAIALNQLKNKGFYIILIVSQDLDRHLKLSLLTAADRIYTLESIVREGPNPRHLA